jgi:hypothetical protein
MNFINTAVWQKDWTAAWSAVVSAVGVVITVAPQIGEVLNMPIVHTATTAMGLNPYIGVATTVIGAITYISKAHPAK